MSDRGKCDACASCDTSDERCYYCDDPDDAPGGCRGWHSRAVAEEECENLSIPDHGILVLPYHRAPYALRQLSECGGDEDWITVYRTADDPSTVWIENLGCCANTNYAIGPYTVWIASHA